MTKIIETIILVSCSFGTGMVVTAYFVRRQINRISPYTKEAVVYARMRVTNESLAIMGSVSYIPSIIASGLKLLAMDSFWIILGAIAMVIAGVTMSISVRLTLELLRLWRQLSIESDSS